MNISKIIHFEIKKKGSTTIQAKAMKIFVGFLALMLLFTILSRSVHSFTTPIVTTTTITSMSIEHNMTIAGQTVANRDVIITTVPNVLIASINVAEGTPVKKGDVLFRLDLTDLDTQLLAAKDQLEKMELQQQDIQAASEVSAEAKETTIQRAIQDYYRVLSDENQNVQKALDDLNNFVNNMQAQKDQILETHKADIQNKQTAITRATEDYTATLASANLNIQRAMDDMNDAKSSTDEQRTEIKANQAIAVQNKQTQVKRATEDYNSALAAANTSLQRAYDAMTTAKNKWDNYTGSDATVAANLQDDYAQKKQVYDDAVTSKANSLTNAQRAIDDANAIVIPDISDQLEALDTLNKAKKQAYDDAVADKARNLVTAQRAIDDANAITIADPFAQISAVDAAYKAKKDAYNQAIQTKEDNLITAQRALDDAKSPYATNHSADIAALDLKTIKDTIHVMEAIKASDGVIAAPANGTVKKLNITGATKTSDGVAILLTDASLGYCFQAKVDRDTARAVTTGDPVTMHIGDTIIQNLKIDSKYVSLEDSNFYQVTVNVPANTKNIGSTASIEINKKSDIYSSCVPLGVLHTDGLKTYVLAITNKTTVLGSETTAERVDVVVEDKNDTMAAISSNFSPDQKLVLDTNKPIRPGDPVRVEEE